MLSVKRVGLSRHMVSASHYVTWQLGKRCSKAIPLVYVVGYPKSGTTWACQIVASYLQLPFPKLSLLPVGFPAVVHGHELVDNKYPYCVYVMRDGRDVMASLYYHIQRVVLKGVRRWLPKNQLSIYLEGTDQEAVRRNFPRFLETQIPRTLGCHHSWAEHVTSFTELEHPHLACLKYEDLLTDGAHVLAREMAKLDGKPPNVDRAAFIMEDFSFSRSSGRQPSKEDKSSFLRKGIAGDWKNHFTREAAEIFDHYCGDALIATGYEPDRSWMEGLPSLQSVTYGAPQKLDSHESHDTPQRRVG
jgi:Sulfotransferase domain